MSNTGLESLNRNVELTHDWLNELDGMLGWEDKHRTFRLLRITLQTLRDCAPMVEAAQFAAQLPTFLRGVFYEHWRPGAKTQRFDVDRFLAQIDTAFAKDPLGDTADAVTAVFTLLSNRISPGEIAEIRQSLPASIRQLWPQ
ncbi:MAG TPA: DUF2267 domain-containing protein [Rhizomicrobium sp.]|nr:DUF2267 domain-containing protein [Rhizomicrobium sp.]